MSSARSDRNRRGHAERPAEYNWSEWVWKPEKEKYYRYRFNSKGKKVWENLASLATSDTTPRGEPSSTTSAAVGTFASSSTDDNQQEYYDNEGYLYHDQTQPSDVVDGLSQGLASTSLTEDGVAAQSTYSYEENIGIQETQNYQEETQDYHQSYETDAQQYQEETQTSHPQTREYQQESPEYHRENQEYQGPDDYQTAQPMDMMDPYRPPPATTYHNSVYPPSGRMQGYIGPTQSSYVAVPTGYNTTPFNYAMHAVEGGGRGDDPSMLSQSYGSDFSQATVTQASHSHAVPPKPPKDLKLDISLPSGDVYREIKGTMGDREKLDPRFKVHDSKVFKPGHIFKVVWPEPKGETARSDTTSDTEVTVESLTGPLELEGGFGERVYSSVRRFVIVATGKGHSQCVPILTYGRKGFSKRGIYREHHAVIYTSDKPPEQTEDQALRPIQVQGQTPRDKLDSSSLVNYAKIYTVEHNVKVFFIGWIAKNSQRHFVRDFNDVWNGHRHMRP